LWFIFIYINFWQVPGRNKQREMGVEQDEEKKCLTNNKWSEEQKYEKEEEGE
jgi:hypothetical protein